MGKIYSACVEKVMNSCSLTLEETVAPGLYIHTEPNFLPKNHIRFCHSQTLKLVSLVGKLSLFFMSLGVRHILKKKKKSPLVSISHFHYVPSQ